MIAHTKFNFADYVLGLMPPLEKERFERHLTQCPECRLAVQVERRVGTAVREALHTAAQPTPAQLRRLQPATPRSVTLVQSWLRPLTAAAVVLVLFVASLSLKQDPYGLRQVDGVTTALAVTATSRPTSTLTATSPSQAVLPGNWEAAFIPSTPITQAPLQLTPVPALPSQ